MAGSSSAPPSAGCAGASARSEGASSRGWTACGSARCRRSTGNGGNRDYFENVVEEVDAEHLDEQRVVLRRLGELVTRGVENVVVVRQLLVEEAETRILLHVGDGRLTLRRNASLEGRRRE